MKSTAMVYSLADIQACDKEERMIRRYRSEVRGTI